MGYACVFPGQGSQVVGMGKALADGSAVARRVFEEVDDALGKLLSRLVFEGPEEELRQTQNAQPAIMAASVAAYRVWRSEGGGGDAEPAFFAGHSLGEYSALVASGALSLSDCARALHARGRAMQEAAAPPGSGVMAAVLGLDLEEVRALAHEAAQGDVCVPANDNAPGQVVVSGHTGAVKRALALASVRGAKRSVLLEVSGPFHSPLMASAAKAMRGVLAKIPFRFPSAPVVANVTARPVREPSQLRGLLVEQVTDMVRWRESIAAMCADGVSTFIEFGPNRVLCGLIRRINRMLKAVAVNVPGDIEAALAAARHAWDGDGGSDGKSRGDGGG